MTDWKYVLKRRTATSQSNAAVLMSFAISPSIVSTTAAILNESASRSATPHRKCRFNLQELIAAAINNLLGHSYG
jgi:hypothetical protein